MAWPTPPCEAYFTATCRTECSPTGEVAIVKDAVVGFFQTVFFLLIVFVVLFGVMLLANYLAAPAA